MPNLSSAQNKSWKFIKYSNIQQLTDWQTYKKFRIIWNYHTKVPRMSPRNFRKIYHPEVELSLYLCNFSKEISQLTDWQPYKKFENIWNCCRNINWISPKYFRKISHPEMDISLYLSNFSKKVCQLTDPEISRDSVYHCLTKNQKDVSCRTGDIFIFV